MFRVAVLEASAARVGLCAEVLLSAVLLAARVDRVVLCEEVQAGLGFPAVQVVLRAEAPLSAGLLARPAGGLFRRRL